MKKVDAYLKDIEAPEALQRRISMLLGMYGTLLTEPVETVFLSDEIDEQGNRTFPSLWLFTRSTACEARIGGDAGDEFDATRLAGRVFHWVARTSAFDMKKATEGSRMKLEVWFSDDLWGDLRATGRNCERLTAVLRTHVTPWLQASVDGEA
jgi:hypothetical protein